MYITILSYLITWCFDLSEPYLFFTPHWEDWQQLEWRVAVVWLHPLVYRLGVCTYIRNVPERIILMAALHHNMPKKAEEVQEKVRAIFGYHPCLWQIEVTWNVLAGKDVITAAPTGAGKSPTYWMPLVFSEKGIVMVVLPLKQLGSQFSNMLNEKGFQAISVTANNSSNDMYSVSKMVLPFYVSALISWARISRMENTE